MNIIGWIIIITFIAGVIGTGIGGLIGAILKRDSSKIVSLLLSFAGGIMLAVVCFDLMQEALHPTSSSEIPFYSVILFVLVGYLLVWLINYLIDNSSSKNSKHISKDHPKTHDDLDELIHSDSLNKGKTINSNLLIAGLTIALVITLHNLPEGMVIGATYSKDYSSIVGNSAFVVSIVIGLHNIPEGMAVSVPLISGGMKKTKAVLITAASGIPTIIGAILGFNLGLISPISLSISLSLASGAMLYVVFAELLPTAILMWKSRIPSLFLLIGFILGFTLILI